MSKSTISVEKIIIPTYTEPEPEKYPMFAENRVHQRTSGRPYPNKVVTKVNRAEKTDREYTVVRLENDYIKVEILPEIGGRIYSALDKTTGYDFFYKQHVIKPALIGVLGSWISGGVEFNWPFHHRASGFMPCDFETEEKEDGTVICRLSEHDPIDRMKGMVEISLNPYATYFETHMKLYNRTEITRSFLWWENAAVPVNKDYRIFFPQDVKYVNFHYLKSRTSYPVTGNCVYNGIPMDTVRDISYHKNTVSATSYFASASDFDFFGGYDDGKGCGVVHIGDHNVSPGKKLFTWGYSQLSKSWENALTDTDGQYAELMAGSYSDNQPNFSWLEPYETKQFSQYWYPINKIGVPTFANLNCAFCVDREKGEIRLITTKKYDDINIKVYDGKGVYLNEHFSSTPNAAVCFGVSDLPDFVTVELVSDNFAVAKYTEKDYNKFGMPDVITDTPRSETIDTADDLYLAGTHVDQYRDPAVMPDAYFLRALEKNPKHIPSLIGMANYKYKLDALSDAEKYILRAIKHIELFNCRPQSGVAYYTYGCILEAKGEYDKALKYYHKSAWAADCTARAMTRIALLDARNGDYEDALKHAENALDYGRNNNLAANIAVIACRELGKTYDADALLQAELKRDPLDHLARFLSHKTDLYDGMDSDPTETCLDIASDLYAMGRYFDAFDLLSGLYKKEGEKANQLLLYAVGYFAYLCDGDGSEYYALAEKAELGKFFPLRRLEYKILSDVYTRTESKNAVMLLGCYLYNLRSYDAAAKLWENCDDTVSRRNLAVAYFSHLDRGADAYKIMTDLVNENPDDDQLLYETVVLMDKLGVNPDIKVRLLTAHTCKRDDILTELAKAYNQQLNPDKALSVLNSHEFVPCEGGEHAIADQYMFAYLVKGKKVMNDGNYSDALNLFREGQTLPQNLGAGIWNHCKLVPLKYHEALCLKALGNKEKANEIFNYIANIQIEYFSNMHLRELPYYQAKSFEQLGNCLEAQRIITKYSREWGEISEQTDDGFFGTTPFFISFTDDCKKMRYALHCYLNSLCESFSDTQIAADSISTAASLNSDNLFALFFKEFGFLK